MTTTTDLAAELDVPEADILTLIDQLIALDGHDAVYVNGRVTEDAAQTIRDQITTS